MGSGASVFVPADDYWLGYILPDRPLEEGEEDPTLEELFQGLADTDDDDDDDDDDDEEEDHTDDGSQMEEVD
jgi:hypothetical protein